MSSTNAMSWHELNQGYLMRELGLVRRALERCVGAPSGATSEPNEPSTVTPSVPDIDPPPALERLCRVFELSRFERAILLLCAGMEIDASFARMIAAAQGDSRQAFPTFSLALAALGEPHWSALSPAGSLRRWRLIEVNAAESLTAGRMRIDERVLHYLVGVSHLDDRLSGLLEWVAAPDELPPSHRADAQTIERVWSSAAATMTLPLIQLCGDESQSQRDVAATACARLGLDLYAISAHALPIHPAELDAFLRLWQREAVLSGCALLLECGDIEASDVSRQGAIARLSEGLRGALILSGRPRRRSTRVMLTLDIGKPTAEEQRMTWENFLGESAAQLNGCLGMLSAQFNFDAGAIRAACTEATHADNEPTQLASALWQACRTQARPQLDSLAQRVAPTATWDDLVLPSAQKQVLREIAIHVRQRGKVYEEWGFAAASARCLGISALFAGPSGTGKTMAGEVLANELQLDLYRIDLSQVVNKYIGETEKNLRRVFDAADAGGAILLFDEADALFGKRSEVKDSHDRYANIEVSYLLQRMEAYRGLAILTTNLKSALDTAFLRRLRFVVQFSFPDAAQRAEIWRRVFPPQTPTEALDFGQLARLAVSGGAIRNIALSAAFLAAEAGEAVGMRHLLQAAKHECQKLERPLNEAEIGGWR
ncbi:MAG: ATP-binding protein [Chloroflexota bacterium]